jgi:hypothetical protein
MFFDLLNIKAPEWYKTFIDGRRLTSQFSRCLPEMNTRLNGSLSQCIDGNLIIRTTTNRRNQTT